MFQDYPPLNYYSIQALTMASNQMAIPRRRRISPSDFRCSLCDFCSPRWQSRSHMRDAHGWLECNFCNNQMNAVSLQNHLVRKHGQALQDLKNEISSKRPRSDTPDGTPEPEERPAEKKFCVNESKLSDEPIGVKPSAATHESFNMIYVSDAALNKFMKSGHIEANNGKLFLCDVVETQN